MIFKTFNTLPNKKDNFWQVILLPTITVLRSVDTHDDYYAVNFEWLFWTLTIIIND